LRTDIFEARPEIVEALGASLMWNVEVDPCLLEGHAEILGDRLGILAGNVELPCGRIVAVLEAGDRRQGKLVIHARVVNIQSRRKKAIADDAVRACRRIEPNPEQQRECPLDLRYRRRIAF